MLRRTLILFAALTALAGCQSAPQAPLAAVPRVELERFMGDWYVIASIPTFLEKGAHNAVEAYRMNDDGTIATTFTFRDGSFDGPEKRYTPRGYVLERDSNAVWGMQFIWPIKADYRIAYLSPDYSQTVIAREARDYVCIMARTPSIAEADYARIVELVGRMGYDTSLIRKVPQRWAPEARADGRAS